MKKTFSNWAKLLLAASIFLSSAAWITPLSATASDVQSIDIVSQPIDKAEQYALFLKAKFNIVLPASVTRGDFISAIADTLAYKPTETKVVFKDLASSSAHYKDAAALYQQGILTSNTIRAGARLSAIDAIQFAIKAAGLEELAYTYPDSKVLTALYKLKWNKQKSKEIGSKAAKLLAAAVDTGLLPAEYYKDIKPNATASASLSAVLLGKVLEAKGKYKHYIGLSSDTDILVKLNDAYRTSDIIKAPALQKVVDTALKQNIVTGYNLKDSRYDANFVDSLSLVYGHSDVQHALQLIGLLRSEKIEAKVQFEPKTSAFIYLKEWGDPGVSDLYEVVQIENGNYIEYAKEYDIAFEFNSVNDKSRFNKIVFSYAKKNEKNQAGLLYESWWQPLYYSLTELKDYKKISNNKISEGNLYAQSFSLKEQSANVSAGFKKIDSAVKVKTYDFWVDGPFYNYLNGESK